MKKDEWREIRVMIELRRIWWESRWEEQKCKIDGLWDE